MTARSKKQVEPADLAAEALLATPEGIATRARIDASTSDFVAADIDRDDHVRHVTLVVLRAKGCA